jgi:hypothetical protein
MAQRSASANERPAARAAACSQVTGTCGPGNYGQWFLPSLDELNALDISSVGGLAVTYYWSSSRWVANYAFLQLVGNGGGSDGGSGARSCGGSGDVSSGVCASIGRCGHETTRAFDF